MAHQKIKTSTELCLSCFYCSPTSSNEPMCMYYIDTGIRRGCKVGECNKHELKKGRKRESNFDSSVKYYKSHAENVGRDIFQV